MLKVNYNTEGRTLHTCRTVLLGHVRRVLYDLPNMSEQEQCCGHQHLSYIMVGADICHNRRTRWNQPHASGRQYYCRRRQTVSYLTTWATRLGSTHSLSLTCKAIPFIYKRGCTLSQKEDRLEKNNRQHTDHSNSLSTSFRHSKATWSICSNT